MLNLMITKKKKKTQWDMDIDNTIKEVKVRVW